MLWRTHLLFGVSSLWLTVAIPPDVLVLDVGAMTLGAALGSLLPDLDASESKVKHLSVGKVKPFAYPADFIGQMTIHRGILHSLLGMVGIGLLTLPLLSWLGTSFYLALLLGYASHLLADACTRTGIPLLYPGTQRFWVLPKSLRISTGSLAEEVPFVMVTCLTLLFLFTQLAWK